jgi:outer membrane protein assembly factor BamD
VPRMSRTGGGTLLLLAVLAAGCSHIQRPPPDAPAEDRLRYGWKLLERRHTYAARQVFEELIFSAPGSAVIDSAHYGLAGTYYEEHNWIQAQSEYDIVVRSFPRSQLVDDAAFRSGYCWWKQSLNYKHDQEETYHAIDAFRTFLLDYPASEHYDEVIALLAQAEDKLARKKIYEGDTYRKLGTERDLAAAELMYMEAIQSWPNASVLDLALWGLGEIYMAQQAYPKALEAFGMLVANFPDSRRIKDARERIHTLSEMGVTAPGTPPPAAFPRP